MHAHLILFHFILFQSDCTGHPTLSQRARIILMRNLNSSVLYWFPFNFIRFVVAILFSFLIILMGRFGYDLVALRTPIQDFWTSYRNKRAQLQSKTSHLHNHSTQWYKTCKLSSVFGYRVPTLLHFSSLGHFFLLSLLFCLWLCVFFSFLLLLQSLFPRILNLLVLCLLTVLLQAYLNIRIELLILEFLEILLSTAAQRIGTFLKYLRLWWINIQISSDSKKIRLKSVVKFKLKFDILTRINAPKNRIRSEWVKSFQFNLIFNCVQYRCAWNKWSGGYWPWWTTFKFDRKE